MDLSLHHNSQWWALAFPHDHVSSNLKKIKSRFSDEGYELFYPRRLMMEYRCGKFQIVEKSLYPGYAFIYCPASQLLQFMENSASEKTYVVRFGEELIPVGDDQLLRMRSLTDGTGLVGISHGVLKSGKIQITSGPLKGHEGEIIKSSPRKKRVTVQVSIGSRLIKLQLACIINQ